MPVLENEKYNKVIAVGKEAVQNLKSGNTKSFFTLAEKAWELFPEPKEDWNQAYNFSKMVFNHSINNTSIDEAKKWLDRMIHNNNNLHLFDYDVDFNEGKYLFETGNYQEALAKWKYVVNEAGLRYFEREKPEYLEFFKNPEKLI